MQGRSRRARYAGEDTRLTSEQELRGWYSYGIAAEVFAVCGPGMLATYSSNKTGELYLENRLTD
jgi:hypothetical protein